VRLYLARHTETNYNVRHLVNSDPAVNVHLTKKGIQEAKHLAEKLSKVNFEAIYISELPRTRQTAEFINQYHHLPLIVDDRINDNATGFEGRPTKEYMEAFKNSANGWREAFNDGESLEDAKNRVVEFLAMLKKTGYNSVLIVTSGFIIECFYGIIHKKSFEYSTHFSIAQGDYDVIEY